MTAREATVRGSQSATASLARFPAPCLRADLDARFGSRHGVRVRTVARLAGLHEHTVSWWLLGKQVPSAANLRRLLEACGLDRGPYLAFLQSSTVTVVCPVCGDRRPRQRSRIQWNERQIAKSGRILVHRPSGEIEVPCRRHTPGQHVAGRARQERRLYQVLGPKKAPLATWIVDERKKSTPDPKALAIWKRVMAVSFVGRRARPALVAELRKPTPNMSVVDSEIRSALANRARRGPGVLRVRSQTRRPQHDMRSIAALLRRDSRHPFHLCPLCGLAIHKSRWHGPCYMAWCRWSGYSPPTPETWPPPIQTRGRPPGRSFGTHLRWLLAQRAHQRTRQALAAEAEIDETSVRKGALYALRLLPGRWDALYTTTSGAVARSANQTRQRYVPLPEDPEFQKMIDAGDRDPLIRRLNGFGMREQQILRITGASRERIRGVLAGAMSTENASA